MSNLHNIFQYIGTPGSHTVTYIPCLQATRPEQVPSHIEDSSIWIAVRKFDTTCPVQSELHCTFRRSSVPSLWNLPRSEVLDTHSPSCPPPSLPGTRSLLLTSEGATSQSRHCLPSFAQVILGWSARSLRTHDLRHCEPMA